MDTTNKICIGLMSGTSIDGLDIIACCFDHKSDSYNFTIHFSKTVPYPEHLKKQLQHTTQISGLELTELNHRLGKYYGQQVNNFIEKHQIDKKQIEFIASHGHTVFHQPENGFTLQIGHGANIAFSTGIKTIADFRIENVIRGGQGAPLVPIGDQLLFKAYDACVNLGGFCNISFEKEGQRIAFDISPCNLPLNKLSSFWDQEYDKDGAIAAKGEIDIKLLTQLNELSFYQQPPPKSLGTEWLEKEFYPLFTFDKNANIMATLVEHVSTQIAEVLNREDLENILITGGGAFNKTLISQIKSKTSAKVIVPENNLVEYKEALIFAFLGWCKIHNINNVLSSVTGSKTDGCHGILFEP